MKTTTFEDFVWGINPESAAALIAQFPNDFRAWLRRQEGDIPFYLVAWVQDFSDRSAGWNGPRPLKRVEFELPVVKTSTAEAAMRTSGRRLFDQGMVPVAVALAYESKAELPRGQEKGFLEALGLQKDVRHYRLRAGFLGKHYFAGEFEVQPSDLDALTKAQAFSMERLAEPDRFVDAFYTGYTNQVASKLLPYLSENEPWDAGRCTQAMRNGGKPTAATTGATTNGTEKP